MYIPFCYEAMLVYVSISMSERHMKFKLQCSDRQLDKALYLCQQSPLMSIDILHASRHLGSACNSWATPARATAP